MTRNKRFEWGVPYLLTDLKDDVFLDEPAIYVGKKDSDMERPTLCAVCGQPLGAEGYHSFFLMGPNAHGIDMMIGNGCIKDRIDEKRIDIKHDRFMDTWNAVTSEFPYSGRWYGTFLHHHIAKPYVKDRSVSHKWNDSILGLPGVRYIMKTIDGLRDDGWALDAEVVLKCGNVDLLAKHPERGTIVFDWKSDLSFDNENSYVEQVSRYISELSEQGLQKIQGYIIWIKDEWMQPVLFKGIIPGTDAVSNHEAHCPSIKCTLSIEMDGGDGIDKKKITGYSRHHPYGNEVSFFIPPCEPTKYGYDFRYFDASPYREGEYSQPFDINDANKGFHVSFICSKKRRSFSMTAHWKRIGPLECILNVHHRFQNSERIFTICEWSKIDDEGNEYVEYELSEINKHLLGFTIEHATILNDGRFTGLKTEWDSEELDGNMIIHLPCIDERSDFNIIIETKIPEKRNKTSTSGKNRQNTTHQPVSSDRYLEKSPPCIVSAPSDNIDSDYPFSPLFGNINQSSNCHDSYSTVISAVRHFTPGHVYKSGGRYYGVYKRLDSERVNSCGKIDIAEVDSNGKKISNLEWRHVYTTRGGKEYVYGLTNREWKIYTKDVLIGIVPSDIDRFGEK